ncbi:Endo-1,4-beta-xylanase A precursor [compost metagenome]
MPQAHQGTFVSSVYEMMKNAPGLFRKPVTIKMKFDPAKISADQRAAIFYYDEEKKEWVEVGGVANGEWITAVVDHFTKFAVLAVGEKSIQPELPVAAFTDIAGHWAENAIRNAAGKGLVNGYLDGTFKPNGSISRAEFTVMLAKAFDLKGTGSTLSFADEAKIGAWAKEAVVQAVEAGIVSGYEDGSFRPNERITRAEMTAMIARALKLTLNAEATTSFADDAAIPKWAKSAVEAIHQLGIVNGRGDGKFVPNETATRAEAITILVKLLEMA